MISRRPTDRHNRGRVQSFALPPSPKDILTSAVLKKWWRADVGVTTVSAVDLNVTAWADQSGNANDGAPPAGNRPDLEIAGFGGRPSVLFAGGSNDHVRCDAIANNFLSGTDQPYTLACAIQLTALGADQHIYSARRNAAVNARIALAPNPTNNIACFRRDDAGANSNLATTQTLDGNRHWVMFEFSGTAITVYIDNVVTSLNGTAQDFGLITLDLFALGSDPKVPAFSLTGRVAESIMANRVLTAQERSDLFRWYQARYP